MLCLQIGRLPTFADRLGHDGDLDVEAANTGLLPTVRLRLCPPIGSLVYLYLDLDNQVVTVTLALGLANKDKQEHYKGGISI